MQVVESYAYQLSVSTIALLEVLQVVTQAGTRKFLTAAPGKFVLQIQALESR